MAKRNDNKRHKADKRRDIKPSLSTLRGALTHLSAADYEDFLAIKTIWEPTLHLGAYPVGIQAPQNNYAG